jgi:hypothetical protein
MQLALIISAAVCGVLSIVLPEHGCRLAGAGVLLLAGALLLPK